MNNTPPIPVSNRAMDIHSPLEVEQKYRISSHEPLLQCLRDLHANELPSEQHRDTYLQHPSHDFAISGEALRIREVNDSAVVTYKGPRFAGPIKTREEIEIPLADRTVHDWMRIWQALGFCEIARVHKQRRSFVLKVESESFTIALDDVTNLGKFVEIEAIVHDRTTLPKIEACILKLAEELQIDDVEPRSYLRQLLEQQQ